MLYKDIFKSNLNLRDFSDGYAENGYLNMIYNHSALQNTTNTLRNELCSDWGNFRILKLLVGF